MDKIVGLLVICGIIYLSSLNWRRTVKALLFTLVIEGALRKWVFLAESDILYFLKDFIILGAYINYYGFSESRKNYFIQSSWINILVFLSLGWCLFQAFNPSLGSPVIGLFGVKAYFFYIPLIWMLPNLFKSEAELYNFLRWYLLLVIPVGLIGIVQFFSPLSSPINAYAAEDGPNVASFGGGTGTVRITGTFSYISGYASYLIVCFGLLLPLLSVKQTKWWQLASIVEILFVVVNMFMTGSRGPVYASLLFIFGYIGLQGLTHPGSTVRLIRKFALPVLIVAIAASIWFRPAIDAFTSRANRSNKDVSARITNSFTQPLEFIKYKELDGYGTGATHQAAPSLRKALNLPQGEVIPTYYESEMGRVTLEIGPIGFILWYGLRVSILLSLWLTYCKLKRLFLRQLALSAFLLQAILLNSHLVFHHTFAVHYWFLSSFIFLLPWLEQVEDWHDEQLQQEIEASYFLDSPYR